MNQESDVLQKCRAAQSPSAATGHRHRRRCRRQHQHSRSPPPLLKQYTAATTTICCCYCYCSVTGISPEAAAVTVSHGFRSWSNSSPYAGLLARRPACSIIWELIIWLKYWSLSYRIAKMYFPWEYRTKKNISIYFFFLLVIKWFGL